MEKISKIIPPNRRTQPEVLPAQTQKPGVFKSRRIEEQRVEKSLDQSMDRALQDATLTESEALGSTLGNPMDKVDKVLGGSMNPTNSPEDRVTLSPESKAKVLTIANPEGLKSTKAEKSEATSIKEPQGYEKMKESQRAQMVENLSKRFFGPQGALGKKPEVIEETAPKSKRVAEQVERNQQLMSEPTP